MAAEIGTSTLAEEISGLDALEASAPPPRSRLSSLWAAAWPKLAAVALFFAVLSNVDALDIKPDYVLPGPRPVLHVLWDRIGDGTLLKSVLITMRRAAIGFGLALAIGTVLGIAVAQVKVLRAAVGSLITGLLTMPSIAWFPFAILLFKLSEGAILFVIVIGGAPAVANGIISGIDHIPPILLRAGRVLGARGIDRYRYVVLPAALPGFIAGLKQGWAFSWRSLLAGEIIVIIGNKVSLGQQLQFDREFADAPGLLATMLVILVIGIVLDSQVFGRLDTMVRRRWGLIDTAT
jgi:NitT/TauT family transport system permease protein